MQHSDRANIIATGLAMFAMFFGAGNLVFPIGLGQYAQDHTFFAVVGLLITAVGVPFLGVIAMILFNGNYKEFFDRIGRVPGFIVALAIMGLIGPFGALPRCITLSYATLKIYQPDTSIILFSALSCVLIYVLTIRKSTLLDMLGFVLTPVLVASLGFIIIFGWILSPPAPSVDHNDWHILGKGLIEGYQTMDLLGAFFFSAVALECLERDIVVDKVNNFKHMMVLALKASLIGASLLAIIYIGLSYTAAFNSLALEGIPQDELTGRLSNLLLGPYGGIIACITVALACLTTAMALAAVFAEFIERDVSLNRISYPWALAGTLVIAFFVSTLHFNGIAAFLAPILYVAYPALIVLTILNILYKIYGFQPVKSLVLATFVISVVAYLTTS